MNKFIVNSEVLLKALQTVAKAFSRNTLVPIIENYLFQVTGTRLTISATDMQTTFKVALSIEVNKGIEFLAVVPPTIVKYLQKIDGEPIIFSWDESSYSIEVLPVDSKERAKYSGDNAQDFPKIESPSVGMFETTSDFFGEFKDLLNYVSGDELRPAMTGIAAMEYKGQFTLTATDAHTLKTVVFPELSTPNDKDYSALQVRASKLWAVYNKYHWRKGEHARKIAEHVEVEAKEIEREYLSQLFIIPSKAAKILSALTFGSKKKPESAKVVCRRSEIGKDGEKTVSFSFPYECFEAELIFRDINEKFPQYWNVIPDSAQTKTVYTGLKDKFLKVVDKALLFANKTTHQIRVCLNGVNKVNAEDLDFSNEYSGEIAGSYSGEPIEIGFNGEFIGKAVRSFGESFNLELIAPNKCGVIRDGNSLVLVMPVMLHQYDSHKSAEQLARELREAREESKNI